MSRDTFRLSLIGLDFLDQSVNLEGGIKENADPDHSYKKYYFQLDKFKFIFVSSNLLQFIAASLTIIFQSQAKK